MEKLINGSNTIDDIELKYTNVPSGFGWQICPKCHGQGCVWFPTDTPYSPTFLSDGKPFECDVCKGKKIIDTLTGLPPHEVNNG